MTQIEIDYNDTLKKADRLEELAKRLNEIAKSKMAGIQSGISRNWKGSAAELYRKKTATLARQLTSQAKSIRSTANSIRSAAEEYRRLERLANSIFGV